MTSRRWTSTVVVVGLALYVLPTARALAAQAPAVFSDDFSRYAEGSDAGAAWVADSIGWAVHGGQYESDGAGRAFAIPRAVPHGRRMAVEAVVRMRKPTGRDWKLAGLGVVRGDGDYWHLALVEGPDSTGSAHSVELIEMLGGRWLANVDGATRLAATTASGISFGWQYDHPYRLRIELTREGIQGTVSELDGTERARIAYAFDHPAVNSGRPALTTASMSAGFGRFRAEIREAAPAPPEPVFPAYRSASFVGSQGKTTGYFHIERDGQRWWVIDPNGSRFYAVGTDHVNYDAHFCEKLGYAPLHRNVERKFGSEERWAADAAARLKRWGFNTLGAGCSVSTRHRGLVHTEFLSLGTLFTAISDIGPRTTWTGFPDVFHPQFAAWCDLQARKLCSKSRRDPWLLGYFLDNELEWFGKNGSPSGLVDEAFKKPADHPAKRALIAFLRKRHPTIQALDQAWGIPALSYDALAHSMEPPAPKTAAAAKDRADFVRLIADRYFAITSAAIRKADPNHMVLGCRFAGQAPPGAFAAAGRYCDIVTVNYYGQVDLDRGISTDMPGVMRRYYGEAKRPLMMTEWSFPALDAGLPSAHGAGQRVPTQADKARCYDIYQRALFSLPFMVGSDYFMWADEPALGISSTFPEDSNYGLIDVNDNAWPELTRTAARVNPLAMALHGGDTAALAVRILDSLHGCAIRVSNSGRRSAAFAVRYWVHVAEKRARITLAPGGAKEIPVTVFGPAYVAAEADPDGAVLQADRSRCRAGRVVQSARVRPPAVLVVNPSPQTLANVPVSIPLGKSGTRFAVRDSLGHPVTSQVDDLPGGPELALCVNSVPARSVAVLRLVPGTPILSRRQSGGDRSFLLPGPLRLEHDAGSGCLIDRVMLGDLPLGRFVSVIHQSGAQPLWVQPDHVERIEQYSGPVRTVVLMTAALGAPEKTPAKTAVSGEGVYAPQQQPAARFCVTYRLARYEGESWFASRMLRLGNTDARSWICASYFHYPISFIGGRAEDDQPRSAGSAPYWWDSAAGAAYGAVVDTDHFRAQFWKDTPDGTGEHPDIWRDIGRTLQPGQAISGTSADSDVMVFGGRSDAGHPGGPVLDRLRAMSRVRAVPVLAEHRRPFMTGGRARRTTGRIRRASR